MSPREAPRGVPAAVIAAAYELDANVSGAEDRALLWRLVEHPDMPAVWRELRRRGFGHEPVLRGLFQWIFLLARQPQVATTCGAFLAHKNHIAEKAHSLLEDASRLLRSARDDSHEHHLDGSTSFDEAWFHRTLADVHRLTEAARVYIETANYGKRNPYVVIAERAPKKRGNSRAIWFGKALAHDLEILIGEPHYSIAATLAGVVLNEKMSADALRKSVTAKRSKRKPHGGNKKRKTGS
jgi:hypothetical protein